MTSRMLVNSNKTKESRRFISQRCIVFFSPGGPSSHIFSYLPPPWNLPRFKEWEMGPSYTDACPVAQKQQHYTTSSLRVNLRCASMHRLCRCSTSNCSLRWATIERCPEGKKRSCIYAHHQRLGIPLRGWGM